MFKKKSDSDIELEKEIKDMDFTWPEIFAMIIAFYKAIFPYLLILSAILIGLFILSMFLLGGF